MSSSSTNNQQQSTASNTSYNSSTTSKEDEQNYGQQIATTNVVIPIPDCMKCWVRIEPCPIPMEQHAELNAQQKSQEYEFKTPEKQNNYPFDYDSMSMEEFYHRFWYPPLPNNDSPEQQYPSP